MRLLLLHGILEWIHHDELEEDEASLLPIEVVNAARAPVPEIFARIPKDEQAAIRFEVDLHVAQVVERQIQL
jgi:hypothetical protein